jgi:hypothetical protein
VVVQTYELDPDDLYDDKNDMLAGVAGGLTYRQSISPATDLAGREKVNSWVDGDSISPLTSERKRVASRETGNESPPKRTLTLRGLQMPKRLFPRDE